MYLFDRCAACEALLNSEETQRLTGQSPVMFPYVCGACCYSDCCTHLGCVQVWWQPILLIVTSPTCNSLWTHSFTEIPEVSWTYHCILRSVCASVCSFASTYLWVRCPTNTRRHYFERHPRGNDYCFSLIIFLSQSVSYFTPFPFLLRFSFLTLSFPRYVSPLHSPFPYPFVSRYPGFITGNGNPAV